MRKYIKNILAAWHSGKPYATSGCGQGDGYPSMTLKDNRIFSYATLIALIKDGVMYLNENKYSATTSRQQSNLEYWGSLEYGLRIEKVSSVYLYDLARKLNK